MPSRLEASGRASRALSGISPSASSTSGPGSRSGSVVALRILRAMTSASSFILIRLMSEASDLLIFLDPSRSDMTRVA